MSELGAVGKTSEVKRLLQHGALFLVIALFLYSGLYALSELWVYKYAKVNRFYLIKTAPSSTYDYVFLGASHAVVMDLEDMNARLEGMTGKKIINLADAGGGIVINRLTLEYLLSHHQTKNVVYFVDSFSFYSEEWNEERTQDVSLYRRAPFDPQLFWLLLKTPATRVTAFDHLFGFSKINNPERFKADVLFGVDRFHRTYRAIAQVDKARIKYLYPEKIDEEVFQRYLAEFEDMISYLKERNINLILVRPPIPERMYNMIPNEKRFEELLKGIVAKYGVELHDFSNTIQEDKFYFDSDHLNRDGVLYFFENSLKGVLTR